MLDLMNLKASAPPAPLHVKQFPDLPCYVLGFDYSALRWLTGTPTGATPDRYQRPGVLGRRGIEFWHPLEETPPRIRNHRLVKGETAPLLSGYMFVWLPRPNLGFEDERVFGLVRGASGGTGRVAHLPEGLIEALRAEADPDGVFRTRLRELAEKPLQKGEQLRIADDDGDWARFVGEFMRMESRDRVRMIVGSIQVVVDRPRIERIGKVG